MRILVLGASGMLGHKVLQALAAHEVQGTVRTDAQAARAAAVRYLGSSSMPRRSGRTAMRLARMCLESRQSKSTPGTRPHRIWTSPASLPWF